MLYFRGTTITSIAFIYQLALDIHQPTLILELILVAHKEILKMVFMVMVFNLVLVHSLKILLLFNMIHKFKKFGIKLENFVVLGMINMKSLLHLDLSQLTCLMWSGQILLVTMLVVGCKFK